MLALVFEGEVQGQFAEGGWFTLPDGRSGSPAADGWASDDGYSLATIGAADPVPEGRQIVSTSVEMVGGAPKYVNVVEDIPPAPVPDRVTARQFKLQLLAAGLLDQVETWVGQQDQAVQIAYASSGTFLRTEPMMETGFAALGFTSGQIDDFYTAAAAL
jgi:hypothetical protein